MTAVIELEYEQLPRTAPAYLRVAASPFGRRSAGSAIAPISACLSGLEARAEHLARYRRVCGFARASSSAGAQTLPVTYPHVLAFPLQMAVLTHRRFPLKLPGLVHIGNQITQYRAIAFDEPLDLTVTVDGHRETPRGIAFDLVTRVRDAAGEALWTESSTMLSRAAGGARSAGQKQRAAGLPFTPQRQVRWDVPENIGRRYAGAAGDYNPIHLSAWTAKLFGFKRAIATGMWILARSAAELEPALARSAYTLSAGFKKPVFLPGRVCFAYALDDSGAEFALTDDPGDALHLSGGVRYL